MHKRLVAVMTLLLSVGVASQAQAGKACSNSTYSGAYGFLTSGPGVAAAGRVVADGNGNISAIETVDLKGIVFPGPFTGTYSINADCSGSAVIQVTNVGTIHLAINITADGNSAVFISTEPGDNFLTRVMKIFPDRSVQQCSASLLTGQIGFDASGDFPNMGPFLIEGATMFDGAGNSTGSYTINVNGLPQFISFTETVSINSDCTYTRAATASNGAVYHGFGVIVNGGGDTFETNTDPGSELALHAYKLQSGRS
jgi:hypothetical protein